MIKRSRQSPLVSLVAVGACAVVLLSGCTSGGRPGSAAPASGATQSSSSVPTSTALPDAPVSTSPIGPGQGEGQASGGDVVACQGDQIRTTLDTRPVEGSTNDPDANKGDYALVVDFTNTSSTPCSMQGYAGADLVDASGQQVKQATRTIRGKLLGLPPGVDALPLVNLQPGAVASAGLEGVNQRATGSAQAGCDAYHPTILLTPPDTDESNSLTVRWPVCYTFEVHPTNVEADPPK